MLNESNCHRDLINNRLQNCESHYFELLNDYYIALENGYQWYIAPVGECTFQIICTTDKFFSSFIVSMNSILTLRSDCIAKNGRTTFTPAKNNNHSTIEIPQVIDIEIPHIPHRFLPQIDLHFIHTKALNKAGLELHEVDKKLHELENAGRVKNWYHTGISVLNKIGYLCITGLVTFICYKTGILTAMGICLRGLAINLWNCIFQRPCQINNFNCSNVSISGTHTSPPIQMTCQQSLEHHTLLPSTNTITLPHFSVPQNVPVVETTNDRIIT